MGQFLKYLIFAFFFLGGIFRVWAEDIGAGVQQKDPLEFDDTFYGKQHKLEELKTILDQFDTYDYVRAKNQKEDLVRFLLGEFVRYDYKHGIARCQNILGVLLRDRAQYAQAIELHRSALESSIHDTLIMIYSLNNLGVVYRRLDKPRIALDYHMNALDMAETFKGNREIAERSACVALNGIGNINLVLNQPEKALEVFRQTLLIEQNLNNGLGMAINYQNIGYAYEAIDKPDTALVYYRRSLNENEKIGSDVGRSICYNSIGELLLKQNSTFEALETFKKAMIFAQLASDNYYISQTHANIGESYLALNNFERAFEELSLFYHISVEINSAYLIHRSHLLLSLYYEKMGDYRHSLKLYKEAVQYNDSIVNDKNIRYLNEIQTLYASEKQQQQIELLTIENQVKTQQGYFYLLLVISLLLFGAIIYSIYKRRVDWKNNELESKLFRSLMDPHFIFNALGSIQNFLYKNEAEKAANYLGHFSKLTRSILQNSNKELITLEEEIGALRNYMEIEQMRLRDCFHYQIDIDADLELDFIYVLPTMIQPFVENSIHHGFTGYTALEGNLKIELIQLKKFVRIIVSDNGKGFFASQNDVSYSNHKSMGLNIFKERIRIIERKYKKSVKFEVQDRRELDPNGTGTIVTIDFPLIEPND